MLLWNLLFKMTDNGIVNKIVFLSKALHLQENKERAEELIEEHTKDQIMKTFKNWKSNSINKETKMKNVHQNKRKISNIKGKKIKQVVLKKGSINVKSLFFNIK